MHAAGRRGGGVRVDKVITSGKFHLDGGSWDVDNNVWVVGDDTNCVIIDPAHRAAPILAAVGDRQVAAVLCTHGHDDHINAAGAVRQATGAPVRLHPADRMLWDMVYADQPPDGDLAEGTEIGIGEATLRVLHTPVHSPGGCSLLLTGGPEPTVFTGDTLFAGGPGATGRSFSDFGTIITSIRDRLLVLEPATVVRTGHGADTSIEAEAPHLDEWIGRGH
jgi:glyoxylase-like metal-dependent hydrolase (beta-lactamase superfamily II)